MTETTVRRWTGEELRLFIMPDTQMVNAADHDRLVAELRAELDAWKNALIDEAVCCHIYCAEHDTNPRKAMADCIAWNVQVALDPLVSSTAAEWQARIEAAEAEIARLERVVHNETDGKIMNGIARDAAEAQVQALRDKVNSLRLSMPLAWDGDDLIAADSRVIVWGKQGDEDKDDLSGSFGKVVADVFNALAQATPKEP